MKASANWKPIAAVSAVRQLIAFPQHQNSWQSAASRDRYVSHGSSALAAIWRGLAIVSASGELGHGSARP